jgi:hypothetical protein
MEILIELLPTLRVLSRADKLRAVQYLVSELVRDEDTGLLRSDKSYPVWSPYDAHEAADILLKALEADKNG